jgi:hypothetical protein
MPIIDGALDAALDYIADACDELLYVSDESVAQGALKSALTVLGTVALTPGDGNGDYVIADYTGSGGGRKLTVAAKNVTASATGTVNSWCLSDGTTVYASEATAAKAVTSSNTYEGESFVAGVVCDATAVTI